ncbi:helix-turn-helix transcriptional regulator [Actinomycetospora lutea]|uniref:helix-turn-helix domain-containing protein n=1 Tax=Actinomycetospora lutea TaxID=663604 RepID=UPI0023660BE5|nr:helix-turn-helix transcriptional regulator [Actinomycetospora lutea]MDD7941180.1 helix-turn-helix transcriptional regulator [Actinomycetospora lutea]
MGPPGEPAGAEVPPDRPRDIRGAPGGGPTVLRIMLGQQLRGLRERAGVTREAAGDRIRGSHAKISRLENGRTGFKERDVGDLLALYGVHDPDERDALLGLARRANAPGWWHRYSDLLPPWFETYVGLEQAASQIRTYEPQFVPGLLQTEAMVRHVTALGHASMPDDEVERRVELRLRRQEVLDWDDAPTLWAVLDEAALRRLTGGPAVMREQLDHLIDVSERPGVVVQMVPFHLGGHAGAGGPFSILRFPRESAVPDVVYLEQLTSALYLDKRADVDDYLATMELLCVQALAPDGTREALRTLRAELG